MVGALDQAKGKVAKLQRGINMVLDKKKGCWGRCGRGRAD